MKVMTPLAVEMFGPDTTRLLGEEIPIKDLRFVSDCGAGLEIDLSWQWENMPSTMMEGISTAMQSETTTAPGSYTNYWYDGFTIIASRQGHNEPVLRAYRDCFGEGQSTAYRFFSGVVGAAQNVPLDRDGVARNLAWQAANNPGSIADAKHQLAKASYKGYIGFMYSLMWGQRHNGPVMATYRAAWRDDGNWLTQHVSAL